MTSALGPLARRMLLAGGAALVGRSRDTVALLDWNEHNGLPRRHVWPQAVIVGRRAKPKNLPAGLKAYRFVEPAFVLVDSVAHLPLAEVDPVFAALRVGDLEWIEAAGDPEVAELMVRDIPDMLAPHRPAVVSERAQDHNTREMERRLRHMRGVTYRCLFLQYPRFGGRA